MLPNFLVIGGNRCATTWVYECLAEHPMIFMSKIKQLHYFDLNYENGIDYYKKSFLEAEKSIYKAIGEASPSYLADERCAKRIKDDLPDAKMIAILRNPIERAFSQYNIFKDNYDKFSSSFEDALTKKQALINDGMYYNHLKRYYKFFDEDQLLILLFDDLKKNPETFIKGIYNFIGVDNNFLPLNLNKKINAFMFPGIRKIIQKLGLNWTVELLKKTSIDNKIRLMSVKLRNKRSPSIKNNTKNKLIEIFKGPNQELASLIGRTLYEWEK